MKTLLAITLLAVCTTATAQSTIVTDVSGQTIKVCQVVCTELGCRVICY